MTEDTTLIGGTGVERAEGAAGESDLSYAPYPWLGAILVVAAFLRCWNLAGSGVATPHYLAGVRSMLQSWHNLFFNAFDPAGVLSLDKPPVAFWLQAASAKLFGFGVLSVLLPQVIEGLAAIVLVYALARRYFGVTAGLLAALFLALTPVCVAVDRSNGAESGLVSALLLAVWTFFNAVEGGGACWLLAAAAIIGIGFNVKMLAAFGVVPTLAAVYLIWGPPGATRRIGQLAGAAAILIVVSLSWCLAYDLTPTDRRPFVDSTSGNSMLELVAKYNFVDRFTQGERTTAAGPAIGPSNAPCWGCVFRLATPGFAMMVGSLYPLAAFGAIAGWRRGGRRMRMALAVWTGWALTYGAVFSAASRFYSYYLAVIAPPICVLAAVGATRLWQLRGSSQIHPLIPSTAIAATALWQAYIIAWHSPAALIGHAWFLAVLIVGGTAAAVGLVAFRSAPAARHAFGLAGLVLLLALPCGRSLETAFAANARHLATSWSPDPATEIASPAPIGVATRDPKLIAFLERSRAGETYVLVTPTDHWAEPIIVATGMPVLALGGYTGRVEVVDLERFIGLIGARQARFAILAGDDSGLGAAQRRLADWIRQNGRAVDPALWRSSGGLAASPEEGANPNAGAVLYDLRPEPDGGS